MTDRGPLDDATAHAIFDILVEHVGHTDNERNRHMFIHAQTTDHCIEYRFIGSLGFGGKFYRNSGFRPDGTWGEIWRIDCYPEDYSPERRGAMDAANLALAHLQGTAPNSDTGKEPTS